MQNLNGFVTFAAIVEAGSFSRASERLNISFDDLIEFFKRIACPNKQFTVMEGISHASFQQKNYLLVYHILHSFFSQPQAVYRVQTESC
jgi:alpha-beta hydrolase superfamily lysophospholipase